jgi:phage tail tape-measure protein
MPEYNEAGNSLAYEEHIDSAEIKLIKIGQRGKTIVGRMLAGIELQDTSSAIGSSLESSREAYHDRFAFVLNDVAGPSNLVPTTEAEEHQLISRINWLLNI